MNTKKSKSQDSKSQDSKSQGSSKSQDSSMQDKQTETPLFELFHDELKDIYWAEKHITKALPKMIKNAESEELVTALENHLEETKGQIERLDQVFSILGKKAQGKKCEGIDGITKEGEEMMEDFKDSPALDAAIIAAGQKVEHYEIASYGTLVAYAKRLELDEVADLLQETLDEEGAADKKLTEIAESVSNEDAAEEVEESTR